MSQKWKDIESYFDSLSNRIVQNNNNHRSAMYQLGYPGNYKEQELMYKTKYKICSQIGALQHTGNVCEEASWIVQLHEEECILIKELIAPWGASLDNSWSYVTTGGTEGNLAGIKFSLLTCKESKPLLVFSRDTHHSVHKAYELCKHSFRDIIVVPTSRSGEMDYKQMKQMLQQRIGEPDVHNVESLRVVMVANLGTTMKGACDNISHMKDVLLSLSVKKEHTYTHVDAAFFGGFWHLNSTNPTYKIGSDFDSLAISGWKWHGSEICGLYLMHSYKDDPRTNQQIGYLGRSEATITGTRNGGLALGWRVRLMQFDWQVEYNSCLELVTYARDRFNLLSIEYLVNPGSLIICFPVPDKRICDKYVLPSHDDDEHLGLLTHVILAPHVTKSLLQEFFKDLELSTCINKNFQQI